MSGFEKKSLDHPDEKREIARGSIELTQIGSHTVGRGVLKPGWVWSVDVAPFMGVTSCPIHHTQLVMSGHFAFRMDDGEEFVLGPNEMADVPPGHDAWVVGDEPVVLIDIGGNIAAIGLPPEYERVVSTILLTDIVDSTRHAEQLGSATWRQVIREHNQVVRVQLDRFRGTEIKTTGDGFLVTFESAVSAVRAADAIRKAVTKLGIEIRAAVHTGEIERVGDDISGIAVHAAARILSLAGPSEVLVSSLTHGLAEGSGLGFEDRGRHEVKGLERPLEVFALTDAA